MPRTIMNVVEDLSRCARDLEVLLANGDLTQDEYAVVGICRSHARLASDSLREAFPVANKSRPIPYN